MKRSADQTPGTGARPLRLGFSPCPNDTFVFHALLHGLVEVGDLEFEAGLADVETLNRMAIDRRLDVAKVSYGALPYLLDEYALLRSGGALGRGCGPLLVARDLLSSEQLRGARIAVPGRFTTANLLLRLYEPEAAPGTELRYDRIVPAVAAGEFDAGLIIHESRFTYPARGLVQVADLGAWWEATTGAPIPLGAIVARRSLGSSLDRIDSAIRRSVEFAIRDPAASAEYVARHARELSCEVTRRHIELYVTEFSIDLGEEGEAAVTELLTRAASVGLVPAGAVGPNLR
jgi:1,4-dihydroxy-6-naphthoate synthase